MKMSILNKEPLTEERIIEKVLSGDVAVFEILIRRLNPVLYKIGRMYGFNHQDTEDLMQDTHVAAYMQLGKFEKRSSYKTWISRIMINKCIYRLKYGYTKNEIPSEQVPESHAEAIMPEQKLLNRELSMVLEKCLGNIPLNYRSVFVMREIEGFSTAETAELMGITEVNVKVRLNRAKVLLQKQVEHFYSISEIYSFNLIYCDKIVQNTLEKIMNL